MSKNVFNQIGDIKNNVNRSSFDWTHDNNFTTELGRITPVFCEVCPPNSSLRIKPTFGLKFMPMMFPIQTKMKAYMSFYKVPLRTLWKDYQDWISSANDPNCQLEPPYMSFDEQTCFYDKALLGLSGLSDYFGVPIINPNVSNSPVASAPNTGNWSGDSAITEYYTYADVEKGSSTGSLTKAPTAFTSSDYLQYIGNSNNPNDPSADVNQKKYGIYRFAPAYVKFNPVKGNFVITFAFRGKSTGTLMQSFNIWKTGGNILRPCLCSYTGVYDVTGISQFGHNIKYHSPRTDGEYTIVEISAEFYSNGDLETRNMSGF